MKFCWCTIYVRDLDESVAFYRDQVGLPVQRRFGSPSGVEIAFLGEGETKVELIRDQSHVQPAIGGDISIGFEVVSLEEKIQFLAGQGIPVHSGPFQPNPHIRFFYALDPNGLKIQFVENIA